MLKYLQDPKSALSNILSKIDKKMSPQKPNIEVSVSIEVEREVQEDESDIESDDEEQGKPEEKVYKQCLGSVLPEDIIKEEVLKLMGHSTSIPDKIIEMEIRNSWGKYVQPQEEDKDEYESIIQTALTNFKQWKYKAKERESILAYKCYICNIGWWRLTPFEEHIKQHEHVKVNIEPFRHECCIVAFYGEQEMMREVEIDGLCHYCLRRSSVHAIMKHQYMYYFCDGCRGRFVTCTSLFSHEGTCGKFQKMLVEDNMLNEYSVCPICKVNCLTQDRYEQHISLKHTVNSDEPVTYSWPIPRPCLKCGLKYFFSNLHMCPKKNEFFLCAHCYRKFQHLWQLNIHLTINKSTINCSICCQGIKQCSEAQHMLKHTKNYVMAYKCQRCVPDVLFPDSYSARQHCEMGHNIKYKAKLRGYHSVSICFIYSHLTSLYAPCDAATARCHRCLSGVSHTNILGMPHSVLRFATCSNQSQRLLVSNFF